MALFLPGRGIISHAVYGAASAFVPTDISGLQLWLDASDGATITQSGGAVSQWNDKSGNGNNVVQATGSRQPIVQTADQNGKDTLAFTSAALKRMTIASPVSISSFSIVAVASKSTGNVADFIGLTSSGAKAFSEWASDNKIYAYGSTKYFPSTTAHATSAYHTIIASVDNTGNTATIYYDGVDETAAGVVGSFSASSFDAIAYGDSLYSDMKLAEILVYNKALSGSEVSSLYSYEKSKWGTP